VEPSLNVTVTALLDFQAFQQQQTRTVRFGPYPGNFAGRHLVGRVDHCVDALWSGWCRAWRGMTAARQHHWQFGELRVPLDEVRSQVKSLPWRPFILSEHKVGVNWELIEMLRICADFQGEVGRDVPLLVDEKIFYQISRFMYAPAFKNWDMVTHMRHLPLVYGIWHPYKACLGAVYKAFFGVLAHLEPALLPEAGKPLFCTRKVQYLEKLFAGVILAAPSLKDKLKDKIRRLGSLTASRQPAVKGHLELLRALRSLLDTYLPMLFWLGTKVRACTWEGRPGGDVKGDTAKAVLQGCLVLLAHLGNDWHASQEYTKSLSLALLLWLPWHTALPGCCFVEESCEALLARAARRLRKFPHLKGQENAMDLFLTLEPVDESPKDTDIGFSGGTVELLRERIEKRLIDGSPSSIAIQWHKNGTSWHVAGEQDFKFPGPLQQYLHEDVTVGLFRGALTVLMTSNVKADPRAVEVLDRDVPRMSAHDLQVEAAATTVLQTWRLARNQAIKDIAAAQRASEVTVEADVAADEVLGGEFQDFYSPACSEASDEDPVPGDLDELDM
jgi:hypothetical protein